MGERGRREREESERRARGEREESEMRARRVGNADLHAKRDTTTRARGQHIQQRRRDGALTLAR
jgi:hypothetical protein